MGVILSIIMAIVGVSFVLPGFLDKRPELVGIGLIMLALAYMIIDIDAIRYK